VVERLDHLVDLGITAIELMPLADFPGRRNWGYDGVNLFAPDTSYGRPEDLKALIDAAHGRGLMVFLDVVYNHFGPEGNYLHAYAKRFFNPDRHTPWGAAINFDGPDSAAVREFFIHNALFWIEEYRIDGLRLDAVHAIEDDSEPDILVELAERVRAHVGADRHVHLVLENDDNRAGYLARTEDSKPCLYDAQWNDDIHHVFHVLVTGEHQGYYLDYAEEPVRQLIRCLIEGFAYQGDASRFRSGAARGEPSADLPATAFVNFVQNHDQIGNRAFGERISAIAPPEAVRAATAILLLAPSPPLLFMGGEWAAPHPFLFFCDFGEELSDAVREGRRKEFAAFPEFRDPAALSRIPDPNDEDTFDKSKLDWTLIGTAPHDDVLSFHKQLLALRKKEIMPRLRGLGGGSGSLVGQSGAAFALEWRMGDGSALTLVANMASTPEISPAAQPRGRLVYATEKTADWRSAAPLPPWAVAWFVDETGAGRA
jgi:malto-oligosyltrehalose trehalohydrolase